jgi:hypothetical protein
MEKVTGIGGLFFRAQDPEALARWYLEHLGVALKPSTYDELLWRQEAGRPRSARSRRRPMSSAIPSECGW